MPRFPKSLFVLAVAVGTAACGATSSARAPVARNPAATASTAPRPSATAAMTLATTWDGEALIQRRDSLVLTLPNGSRQVQLIGRDLRFTVTLKNGNLVVRLDSLSLMPSAPALAQEAAGTSWNGKLGAFGRLEELRPSRSGVFIEELTNAVATLLPRLPRGGVRAGERWSDTTERTVRVEIFRAQEQRIAQWAVHPVTEAGGLQLVPVALQERFEQIGKGTSAGREMRMTAQGSRSGIYYVTLDGRVDRVALVDSIAKLITIPASGQSIPTMQYSRTVIQFRPHPARRPNG